ncbi:hypothetical protein GCM10009740_37100 [Terrabacter terrae]|uniref:Uncharacterized protein n=1 Tax=Terrabacter terrae TaxID=318434 RepID=A0ABN2UNV0_9MICO
MLPVLRLANHSGVVRHEHVSPVPTFRVEDVTVILGPCVQDVQAD